MNQLAPSSNPRAPAVDGGFTRADLVDRIAHSSRPRFISGPHLDDVRITA